MSVVRALVTVLWLLVAGLQVVALVGVRRRPALALAFALAAGLLTAGAVLDHGVLLALGCGLAAGAPLAVGLARPDGPRWSHHVVRGLILLGLLILSTWV